MSVLSKGERSHGMFGGIRALEHFIFIPKDEPVTVKLSALHYLLILGNKTVPMFVLYASCDCTTKNGSGTYWLCNQHHMILEHLE